MTAADWFDRPGPSRECTRRPFDDVLADFAARTDRPCWPVVRVSPSNSPAQQATRGVPFPIRAPWGSKKRPTENTTPASVATAGQGQSDSTPTRSTTNEGDDSR